ncbi:MAG: hypothetical protein KTR15_15110 [Phycisphaeraceae bacterium]|nr:hypothetical protein [Phycisphaeraceae bacterium]
MAGFDLDTAIAERMASSRKAGVGMLVAGGIGWLVVLGLIAGVMWLIAAFGGNGSVPFVMWILLGVGGVALVLVLATGYFYFNEDAVIEVRDERTFMEQVTGDNAIAGEFAFAMFLVIPQITADGLRDLTNARSVPDQHLEPARRIAKELHEKNDWLPLSRYGQHLDVVAAMVRLDLFCAKEVYGRPYIRLNPSLYD